MQNRTRRLWDQDINIVKGGLDEEQVVGFVGELMAKYRALLERQVHFVSLGTLSEKTAAEADRLAADIKARAKEEADADAKSIIASANQRAQEMLASAKKTAQDVNRREVDSILEAAYRKAAIIDTEAKQRAQLFLIRARAVIEENLKDQFRGVYNQLLTAIRDLVSEGHDIETGWKGKLTQLWKKETLELEGFEAMPSLLAAEMAKAASLAGMETEIKIETPKEEITRREEVIREVPPVPPAAEVIGASAPEEAETVAEAVEAVAAEVDTAAEGVEAVAEEPPREEVTPGLVPPESGATYEGEIELTLIPPIEMATMSKIYDQLQAIPEVKILRTVGSRDKGPTITVLLEKQIPLVEVLAKIPGVEALSEQSEKGTDMPGVRVVKGKRIALKTQPG